MQTNIRGQRALQVQLPMVLLIHIGCASSLDKNTKICTVNLSLKSAP